MPTYSLHGLTFASERPLWEHAVDDRASADVIIRSGPGIDAVTWEGERLLADASPFYRVLGTTEGYVVSFAQMAEFVLSPALDDVEVRVLSATSPELVEVLLVGTVIATLLALRGECVLHAAAVEVDGGAVVIAGHSGAGKTTLAAALCAVGGLLISDDVLRASARPDGAIEVHPGTRELRLREQALSLADVLDVPRRLTADERTALRPSRTTQVTLPVRAMLLPRHAQGAGVSLREISRREALVDLLGLQRTLGWRIAAPHQSHFAICARLAVSARSHIATVPLRGIDGDVGRELLRQVRDEA